MLSEESNALATVPSDATSLQTKFCADDPDVVIRAAGTVDFRTHKFILSLASPVFKDMFTLPQPPSDDLPRVDVQDSANTWENILRTIYPNLSNPTIGTLDDLQSLLSAAQAYDMKSVVETYKNVLEHREFMEEDPLRLYAIACMCGFEDQATHIARNAELFTVIRHSDSSDLKGLTLSAYRRLLFFLYERDTKWNQTIEAAQAPFSLCDCRSQSIKPLYDKIKEHLRWPFLQTKEVYLKACEDRPLFGCSLRRCPYGIFEINGFIQHMIEEREKVCDEFQPAKWYCERTTTLRPNPFADIVVLIRFA